MQTNIVLCFIISEGIFFGNSLVYYILWSKIIRMKNLSHEWLLDFMCTNY